MVRKFIKKPDWVFTRHGVQDFVYYWDVGYARRYTARDGKVELIAATNGQWGRRFCQVAVVDMFGDWKPQFWLSFDTPAEFDSFLIDNGFTLES